MLRVARTLVRTARRVVSRRRKVGVSGYRGRFRQRNGPANRSLRWAKGRASSYIRSSRNPVTIARRAAARNRRDRRQSRRQARRAGNPGAAMRIATGIPLGRRLRKRMLRNPRGRRAYALGKSLRNTLPSIQFLSAFEANIVSGTSANLKDAAIAVPRTNAWGYGSFIMNTGGQLDSTVLNFHNTAMYEQYILSHNPLRLAGAGAGAPYNSFQKVMDLFMVTRQAFKYMLANTSGIRVFYELCRITYTTDRAMSNSDDEIRLLDPYLWAGTPLTNDWQAEYPPLADKHDVVQLNRMRPFWKLPGMRRLFNRQVLRTGWLEPTETVGVSVPPNSFLYSLLDSDMVYQPSAVGHTIALRGKTELFTLRILGDLAADTKVNEDSKPFATTASATGIASVSVSATIKQKVDYIPNGVVPQHWATQQFNQGEDQVAFVPAGTTSGEVVQPGFIPKVNP